MVDEVIGVAGGAVVDGGVGSGRDALLTVGKNGRAELANVAGGVPGTGAVAVSSLYAGGAD